MGFSFSGPFRFRLENFCVNPDSLLEIGRMTRSEVAAELGVHLSGSATGIPKTLKFQRHFRCC